MTLTGAFKNAGDYLIGHRARALLAKHVHAEAIDINRKAITESHYDLFNSARAVLLTGGPAYQEKVYPNVFDLDLTKIKVPVLAYGLGWKGKLGQEPEDFRFSQDAENFVQAIHRNQTLFSSARDHLTVRMLEVNGVSNVWMTGCPAWYDETKLEQDFEFDGNPKTVVLSMPAVPQEQVPTLMAKLASRFPNAKRYLSFQAGYSSTHSKKGAEYTRWNRAMLLRGLIYGFKPVEFAGNFEKFAGFMAKADFHIGYRVHSHIFCISQRKGSILIAEDSRGIGQVAAMGGVALSARDTNQAIAEAVDDFFDSQGVQVQSAVETMRATHGRMLEFLAQI